MKNRAIVPAIGLGLILSLIVPAIIPRFVFAQSCTDARGNPIACPVAPDQGGHKKKPTPTRPRDYKTNTPTATPQPTLTPSITAIVSLTPTKVAVAPIIPSGDGPPPVAPDSGSDWPLQFGSETTQMLFDGDPLHKFPGGSLGLLGILIGAFLGVMGISFVLKRADRIKYEESNDDTHLIFGKRRPKDGSMPLATEIGFPDSDSDAKESPYIKDPFTPGSSDINADGFADPITGGDQQAEPHVVPGDSDNTGRDSGKDD